MNNRQKEILQSQLNSEEKTIRELKSVYSQAAKDIDAKIRELSARTDMENLQSIIYQKQYQEILKKQIDSVLDTLQTGEFSTVQDFLTRAYNDSFIGTMYDLHGQGVPLIIPIDSKQVVEALQTDSKISTSLYTRLGEDVKYLKNSIRAELSRGIVNGSSWNDIAAKIAKGMKSDYNKAINSAIRIARTEGHRIQSKAALDSQQKAKENGADIVKQWDSTLDGNTRETHRKLDGQIREVDEDFEVNGMHASAPGYFGDPAEDCNCRCAVLQRAKWALNEAELETLKERAEFFELDKTKDFDEFKEKYLNVSQNADAGADSESVRSDAQKMNEESTSQDQEQEQDQTQENQEQNALEDEALEWYVSGEGMWINQYLRGKGDFGELSSQEQTYLEALKNATHSEIVHDDVLYRSVDASAIFGDISQSQYDDIYNSIKYNDKQAQKNVGNLIDNTLGKTITEKGFMSTTKDEEIAFEFGDFTGSEKPAVLKLNVPEGINGKDLAAFDVEGDEQKEVLLTDGQNYIIKDISAKDGNLFIEADLISFENSLENVGNSSTIKSENPNILFKSELKSNEVRNEMKTAIESYDALPKKVQDATKDVTFNLGGNVCRCDYNNGIVYLGKGSTKEMSDHEIGHLVEHWMMDAKEVEAYKKSLVEGLSISDISIETYENNAGEEVKIFIVKGEKFVSEYQGRIYSDSIIDAINEDGSIKIELMEETISEPFRMFQNEPEELKKHKEIFSLLERVVK